MLLPVKLNGTRHKTLTSWRVSFRRSRKLQLGLFATFVLVICTLVSLAVVPRHLRSLQPAYCSTLEASSWYSRTAQAAGQQGSSSPPASSNVPQAFVQVFVAVHAAAEQGLQLADMVWRSLSQPPDQPFDPCPECNKKQAGKQKQQTAESNRPAQPTSGPPVATVAARLNFSAILAGVGEYPQGSSKGRGIVLVGGGTK